MQHLTRLSAAQDAAWYQIGGDHAGRVDRYLVSTPASRAVSNKPEEVNPDWAPRLFSRSQVDRSNTAFLRTKLGVSIDAGSLHKGSSGAGGSARNRPFQ